MKTKHTPGKWFIKTETNDEYPKHIDYSIHAEEQELHTEIDNETSPLWKFKPHIADIKFGRANEEREANAKLCAAAPELLEKLITVYNWARNGERENLIVFQDAYELISKLTTYKNANE